ncbi:YMGG-like glycine zipper-containing protein [Manganibacter manganicus]|uniref:YMGG-like Gly-zipper domain-containing protein n=1 Tax=Manganibacter manganicus TaxID=1873176 RepID=A0A1V8RVB7_9HYPH|nr:YMGG-like glycine zipper-containing protein [Pseudaminobacter manganicus]OQM76959.1 hypothetical protein BFN67_11720 [Pseudaminobacter manganicus]
MKTTIAAAMLLSLALAGCASTPQQQRTGTGALLGAGAGALAGQAIGGDTKSTLIGAASGAAIGGIVGSATAPRGEEMCRYRSSSGRVYTAPCDDRYYDNGGY